MNRLNKGLTAFHWILSILAFFYLIVGLLKEGGREIEVYPLFFGCLYFPFFLAGWYGLLGQKFGSKFQRIGLDVSAWLTVIIPLSFPLLFEADMALIALIGLPVLFFFYRLRTDMEKQFLWMNVLGILIVLFIIVFEIVYFQPF